MAAQRSGKPAKSPSAGSALARYFQARTDVVLLRVDRNGVVKNASPGADSLPGLLTARGNAGKCLSPLLWNTICLARAAGENSSHCAFTNDPTRQWNVTILPLSPRPNAELLVALTQSATDSVLAEAIQRTDRVANLGNLSASLAHEIKNALVAVRTFIDLLLEKNPDADLADLVRHEVDRVTVLVNRMARFPKIGEIEKKEVHLHPLLDHLMLLVQPQLRGKLITVERKFDAGSDLVVGDENELEQALLNLVLNAVEAMGPSGTLTISTTRRPARSTATPKPPTAGLIRIEVRDTGPGIDPAHRQRLFEPFFTTKRAGTGLGLAITERIVLEHGGTIDIDSLTGQGTTFAVSLPAGPG